MVLQDAGRASSAGYDLKQYAESGDLTQPPVWDPIKDFRLMKRNTDDFFSLWRSLKPTIAKVHGHAVAGGSDIALSCDLVVMADDARIGYMPARVWGCPTTAMWVYRLGAERAKRMLLTGDTIDGATAAAWGLVLQAVPCRRTRSGSGDLGRPDRRGTHQPAGHAEAHDQPGLRQHESARHADPCDVIRRHHPAFSRGPLVPGVRCQAWVRGRGGVARFRPRDPRRRWPGSLGR
ncbi:enoyl-CoA hydratase-related protein [Nocardia sp. CA-120079]|uniref:enoyl-CoA hydratase-related protein n=1 Tax=Nocardia sp. CA-120079 TaxID=3239974 RepID=UPI003D985CE9